MLLVLVLVPLALRATWRARFAWGVAFVVPAVVLIGGWAIHNGIRYDNYTIARGGNATVPFFRAFVTDKIVRPSNGPASRELAAAVQRDLLTKEPYRSYGITLDEFFSEASPRMQVDLLALSDRLKGWHSNYRWLRDVGVEGVDAHPARYARGVLGSVSGMLRLALYRSPTSTPAVATGSVSPTVTVKGHTLPEAERRRADSRGARRRSHDSRLQHLHGVDLADRASSRLRASRRRGSATTRFTAGWTSLRRISPTARGTPALLTGSTSPPVGFRRRVLALARDWLRSPFAGSAAVARALGADGRGPHRHRADRSGSARRAALLRAGWRRRSSCLRAASSSRRGASSPP